MQAGHSAKPDKSVARPGGHSEQLVAPVSFTACLLNPHRTDTRLQSIHTASPCSDLHPLANGIKKNKKSNQQRQHENRTRPR
eukprot:6334605-Amphidinium_carterae.1